MVAWKCRFTRSLGLSLFLRAPDYQRGKRRPIALRFPPRLAAKRPTKAVSRVLKRRPRIAQVISRQRQMGPAQGEPPGEVVDKAGKAGKAEVTAENQAKTADRGSDPSL